MAVRGANLHSRLVVAHERFKFPYYCDVASSDFPDRLRRIGHRPSYQRYIYRQVNEAETIRG